MLHFLWPIPASQLRRATAVALFAVTLLARPAVAVDYDVYILAGQSNMDGRGLVSELVGPLEPFAGVQHDVRIWYSNGGLRQPLIRSDGWQPLRPGYSVSPPGPPRNTTSPTTGPAATRPSATRPLTTRPAVAVIPPLQRTVPGPDFGPEIGFAKTMTDAGLPGGHRLAIIKYAASGSNLRVEWNPRTDNLLYARFVPFARQGLATLKGENDTVTLRGFLWHQGESDTALKPEQYQQLLTDLIAAVRKDFDAPDLPVYLGEPFDNGRRLSIRAAQLLTARSVPHVFVIGSGGLETLDAGTHFNAASQIELGRRFATAVLTGADVMPSPMPAPTPVTAPATTPATGPTVQDPP